MTSDFRSRVESVDEDAEQRIIDAVAGFFLDYEAIPDQYAESALHRTCRWQRMPLDEGSARRICHRPVLGYGKKQGLLADTYIREYFPVDHFVCRKHPFH